MDALVTHFAAGLAGALMALVWSRRRPRTPIARPDPIADHWDAIRKGRR